LNTRDGGQVQTKTTDDAQTTKAGRAKPLAPRTPAEATKTATGTKAAGTNVAGTYVADSFSGDIAMTMGGTPALAHDGQPAGLARVTLAMREPVRRESPAPRRLVGLCSWAAGLGILGAIMAIRAAIAVMVGTPSWYLPTVAILGVCGVCATMGGFVTARVQTVPWALLGVATFTLAAALVATLFAA
jgi:hypothetical protein